MNEPHPLVVIYIPVDDNIDRIGPAVAIFEKYKCPYDIRVSSILAMPEKDVQWASGLKKKGVAVIIACCGEQLQAPGILAAASGLPLIAIPMTTPHDTGGMATLQVALGSSAAAPVAVVRPNDTGQAALLALRILGLGDTCWADAVAHHDSAHKTAVESGWSTAKWIRKQACDNTKPHGEYDVDESGNILGSNMNRGHGHDVRVDKKLNKPTSGQGGGIPARLLGRQPIDPEVPDPALIEDSVDCLLEGGIVALATDTVYGIAADATNPVAVERLFEIKHREKEKALVILIDSSKQLAGIAKNLTVEVRRLTEAFWPGPLTIIFKKRRGNFDHLGSMDSIGIRMPDHSIPLAMMQALARPLACTSANISGHPDSYSADDVEHSFGNSLNAILDSGHLEQTPPSTVIDVTCEKYRVLRNGRVSIEQLATILGEHLETEN